MEANLLILGLYSFSYMHFFFSVSFEDTILKICKTGLSQMAINIGIFFKDVEHINWILLGCLYELPSVVC